MERRFQVFVSSTYLDLIDERRRVIEALLELDCMPAGMELFAASNDTQWNFITKVIDQCDYYVVIVGGRYGSTVEGISYTEKEYDYAVDRGIPVMGFVHSDPDQIIAGKTEINPEARDRLRAFRDKVMSRMVKRYSSPPELGSAVYRAVNLAIKNNPRPGWVRGEELASQEAAAEISELRVQIIDLRRQLDAEEQKQELDASYKQGSDLLTFQADFIEQDSLRSNYTVRREVSCTWDKIFKMVGPNLMNEISGDQLRARLEKSLGDDRAGAAGDTANGRSVVGAKLASDEWGRIIIQLRAIGLIVPGVKVRPEKDNRAYWTLSVAGSEYLTKLIAQRR